MLQDEDVDDTQICIHKVSKILRAVKPEAYTPQLIGLGPYHHWREDLYEMQQYKFIASKRSQKDCCNDKEAVEKLNQLVDSLVKHDIAQIRACYDRFLDEDDQTLAWMMLVDSLFLLQFLQGFMVPNKSCLLNSPRTSYLLDSYQSAYHSILRDIMKLENQIPIFLLELILPSCEIADEDLLPTMLLETCKRLSPLNYSKDNLSRDVIKHAHLLELMYYLIVPIRTVPTDSSNKPEDHAGVLSDIEEEQRRKCFPVDNIPQPNFELAKILDIVPFLANSKPLKVIHKMVRSVSPVLSSSKGKVEQMLSSNDQDDAPTLEEITIPSVSKLLKVGIHFCPKEDSLITCVEFDKKSRKLYLPSISINASTEVILRNLVAYEAEAISGPSILARYTELMNGIIDTKEDVRLLRERKIIKSYMKSDEDVAQFWNGMNRSTRLTHVPPMDKVIKEVNEFYDNKRRVKFYKFTKDCLFYCWKIVMLLLALVLMVLMCIQSFCDVYRCPRVLGPVNGAKRS